MSRFKSPGFFIEAGALDGFFESNTYNLERFHGWNGILIEPIPDFFKRIKTNRPHTTAFHCALVSANNSNDSVFIQENHAFSSVVDGTEPDENDKLNPAIAVEPRTLTSILDEIQPNQIDLLSLDVEGYEAEVLRGLNLNRYQPRVLIIECLDNLKKEEVEDCLKGRYKLVKQITYRDFAYELTSS
ncbi:FkbM family methyltransferase [Thalassoglobus sp.]|uniref:FkbM family methyltransferase n=1 Tax=Thalassoglobus sp. TaxID=2795869 RepID=UPI003AA86BA3